MSTRDPKSRKARHRLRLTLLLLLVLLGIGVGGWIMFGTDRIQPGMTRAEVEVILGPPDGNMIAIGGKPTDDPLLVWKERNRHRI